jgi:diguanylate cyclase (GGDEF)-like protein
MISLKYLMEHKAKPSAAQQASSSAPESVADPLEPDPLETVEGAAARDAIAASGRPRGTNPLTELLTAYRDALTWMAEAGGRACPTMAGDLGHSLSRIESALKTAPPPDLGGTQAKLRGMLDCWGRQASEHYRQKACEVKELLLVLARTAESVGDRDRRAAEQLSSVTERLEKVADLEDLSEIRTSIERSAREMKSSVERMTTEGSASIVALRQQVTTYQARLEAAELQASQDQLTGVRNRQWMETGIEQALESGKTFSVAVIDIDGFKGVNDTLGHVAGDDLLRQFALKLGKAASAKCQLGRWGGDEFLLFLEIDLDKARAEVERLRQLVCADYTIDRPIGQTKLRVAASFGVAGSHSGEDIRGLLQRADEAMYQEKNATGRHNGRGATFKHSSAR